MDGQMILNIVLVLAILVWFAELYWIRQMAEQERRDWVHDVSGAAPFFVAAAPVARYAPGWVDWVADKLEVVFKGGGAGGSPSGVPARLLISGEQKPLTQPRIRLGRYPNNEIVLDHSTVSAYHAEIILRPDGRHEVVDRESRNGTRVNGALVRSQILKDGDLITLGAASLHYLSEASADREAAGVGGAYHAEAQRHDDYDQYADE
jgi:hypothetical protein